jgi:lysophospholipase L1-like esterase
VEILVAGERYYLLRLAIKIYRTSLLMKKCLAGFLIAAVSIVLLEFSARALFTVQATANSLLTPEWYTFSTDVGWEKTKNFDGSFYGVHYQFDPHGFLAIDTEKISNSHDLKILTLGDSVTFGFGVPPESSFPEILDDLLPSVSVINLAVSGYSSFQGYKTLLKYAPTINPALIIVSFGHNDRRYVLSEYEEDSDVEFAKVATGHRWEVVRRTLYLEQLIQVLMSKARLVKNPESVTAVEDVRKLNVRVPPESYRNNLINIARFSKERHIPLIFLVLKDNPMYTEHLRQGLKFLEESRYDLAERELHIAYHLHNPFSALAQKYLTIAYEQLGNFEEARKIMRLEHPFVSLHGGDVLYQDVEYNEIMRSVGRQYGITLVEAGDVMDGDPSLYTDDCHPDEKGHEKIARLLLPAIKKIFEKEGIPIQRTRQSAMNEETGFALKTH